MGNASSTSANGDALRSHRFFANIDWDDVLAQGSVAAERASRRGSAQSPAAAGTATTAAQQRATIAAGVANALTGAKETDVSAFDDAFTREVRAWMLYSHNERSFLLPLPRSHLPTHCVPFSPCSARDSYARAPLAGAA